MKETTYDPRWEIALKLVRDNVTPLVNTLMKFEVLEDKDHDTSYTTLTYYLSRYWLKDLHADKDRD